MSRIPVITATLATLLVSTVGAQAAPWCAQYGGRGGGGTNCGFYSFAQCMAAVSGTGGFCTRNQLENPRRGRDRRRDY
jgi:hypothetical protein